MGPSPSLLGVRGVRLGVRTGGLRGPGKVRGREAGAGRPVGVHHLAGHLCLPQEAAWLALAGDSLPAAEEVG